MNGFVKVAAAFSGPQNRAYLADNTETPTPGYTLINAGVGAGFTNKENKVLFNIYLFAENIFDVRLPGSPEQAEIFRTLSYEPDRTSRDL